MLNSSTSPRLEYLQKGAEKYKGFSNTFGPETESSREGKKRHRSYLDEISKERATIHASENWKKSMADRYGGNWEDAYKNTKTTFVQSPKTTEEAFAGFKKAQPWEKEQAWSSVEGMMQGEQDEEERKKMYEEYLKKKSLPQAPTRKEPPMSELGMLRGSMGRMIG
jgi:hypothetical protein